MQIIKSIKSKIANIHQITIQQIHKLYNDNTTKNIIIEYAILALLRSYLSMNKPTAQAIKLLNLINHNLKSTQLWHIIQYIIWKNDTIELQQKQSSSFYSIFYNWMTIYEQKLSKNTNLYYQCFILIETFIRECTNQFFQRVIFLDQSFDDLKTLITFKQYWQDSKNQIFQSETLQLREHTSTQNLIALVNILEMCIYKSDIYMNSGYCNYYYNVVMKNLDRFLKYEEFIYRSLLYLFTIQKILKAKQKQISKIALLFCLYCSDDSRILKLIKLLISKTTKSIKLAFVREYQEFYTLLEFQNKMEIIQELQNMHQFRELIIKRTEFSNIQLDLHDFEQHQIVVPSASKSILYFEITKPLTLLCIQYYLDGDISFYLTYQGDLDNLNKKSEYFRQNKKLSKNIQILINDCGLHSLTFDNTYSWITSKKIRYNITIYVPYQGANNYFNQLVYLQQVQWKGYGQKDVLSQQQKQYYEIWKRFLPNFIDLLYYNKKWYYNGKIYQQNKINLKQISVKRKCKVVVVRSSQKQFLNKEWIQQKLGNSNFQLIVQK